ncbi:MAG TPA: hypothetical protein VID28_23735 [Methylomirabilota bacterium]
MTRWMISFTVTGVVAGTLLWATLWPAAAAMATIETVQALEDESDEAVKAAIERAVQAAVRGAVAMGLPRVELRGARVLRGMVTVQILAREAEAEGPENEPTGAILDGKSTL